MLFLLASCPAPSPDTEGAPWMELGTGLTAYEELDDGDTIELVAGPQGGWHVDVAIELGGFEPDGVAVQYRGLNAQTDVVVSYVTDAVLYANRMVATDDGWRRSGDRVVFAIDSEADVVGTEVRLEVQSVELDQWTDRVLSAETLEDVFETR